MDLVRTETEWFTVDDPSGTGAVRRAAIRLAASLGFSDERVGEAGIVASEIASNVCRHGGGGTVALQVALRAGEPGVRIAALDHGPGMSDLAMSATDGHSTRGSLGVGLGAIARLSSCVDVSSQPGAGTVLVADVWPGPPPAARLDVAGLTRAMPGQQVCGDAVGAVAVGDAVVLMVADGLGHGSLAGAASARALGVLSHVAERAASAGPQAALAAMDQALVGTRGAAIAVAVVEAESPHVRFAGVGNISVAIDDTTRRRSLLSQPGIVGSRMPTVRPVDVQLPAGGVLVMHSDGIRESWNLGRTPGLVRRGAAVIAASVLRDSASRPDDASILVVRRAS